MRCPFTIYNYKELERKRWNKKGCINDIWRAPSLIALLLLLAACCIRSTPFLIQWVEEAVAQATMAVASPLNSAKSFQGNTTEEGTGNNNGKHFAGQLQQSFSHVRPSIQRDSDHKAHQRRRPQRAFFIKIIRYSVQLML